MNPIAVSPTKALPDDYFATVLAGRNIVPRKDIWKHAGQDSQPLFVESDELGSLRIEITASSSWDVLKYEDGTVKSFLDTYECVAVDENGQNVKFPKTAKHLLIINEDKEVVGSVIGVSKYKGKHTGVIAPAYAFIDPPAEHIREALKLIDHFNPNALLSCPLASIHEEEAVYLEKTPDRRGLYVYMSATETDIGGIQYDHAYKAHSWYDTKDHTETGLKEAYEKAFFATPDDIGKIALGRRANGAVVGVLVKIDAEYSEDHGRWYQKAYLCPAMDVLRP